MQAMIAVKCTGCGQRFKVAAAQAAHPLCEHCGCMLVATGGSEKASAADQQTESAAVVPWLEIIKQLPDDVLMACARSQLPAKCNPLIGGARLRWMRLQCIETAYDRHLIDDDEQEQLIRRATERPKQA